MATKELSDYLARLLLLQNVIALLPDKGINEVVCQGLKDFPGVAKVCWESGLCDFSSHTAYAKIPVKHNQSDFGYLQFMLSDYAALQPYLPYLQNFAAMMAVILETKRKETDATTIQENFFELAPDLMCIASAEGYFTKLSLSWEKKLGFTREELCAKPFQYFVHPDDTDQAAVTLDKLKSGKQVFGVANRYRHKNGQYLWLDWVSYSDENGVIFAVARDITDQKCNEEYIKRLAYYDTLTGLINRTRLHQCIDYSISIANKDKHKMALLLIDLDDFKSINDSLGHNVGDQALLIEAQRLESSVGNSGTVARMGGDEFVIFIETIESDNSVTHLAQKVLKALSIPIEINNQQLLQLTPSIGISVYPDDGTDRISLIRKADTAMYEAKENGKNTFCYFSSEMIARTSKLLSLVAELRRAIELQQFEIYYQPRVCLYNKQISGAEALIRWNHPERGIVSPVEFIPVAEKYGLISQIGQMVIEGVVQQLCQWRNELSYIVPVAINLSAIQFNDNNLYNMLTEYCKNYDLSPYLIELEVTESTIMKQPEQASTILQALREYGFRVAIDDFGTGYSSLAYLKKLPLDILKIDQSFVANLSSNLDDMAIVQTIITLAKTLGLELIAEGVETSDHKRILEEYQCDHVQGYYYARPMPSDRFADFLLEYAEELEYTTSTRPRAPNG